MNTLFQFVIDYPLWSAVGALAVLAVLTSFKYIRETQIGVIVKRFSSKGQLPDGRVVALNGKAGYQAQTLAPGVTPAAPGPRASKRHQLLRQDRVAETNSLLTSGLGGVRGFLRRADSIMKYSPTLSIVTTPTSRPACNTGIVWHSCAESFWNSGSIMSCASAVRKSPCMMTVTGS
mgnify:CR=1 FL=1